MVPLVVLIEGVGVGAVVSPFDCRWHLSRCVTWRSCLLRCWGCWSASLRPLLCPGSVSYTHLRAHETP